MAGEDDAGADAAPSPRYVRCDAGGHAMVPAGNMGVRPVVTRPPDPDDESDVAFLHDLTTLGLRRVRFSDGTNARVDVVGPVDDVRNVGRTQDGASLLWSERVEDGVRVRSLDREGVVGGVVALFPDAGEPRWIPARRAALAMGADGTVAVGAWRIEADALPTSRGWGTDGALAVLDERLRAHEGVVQLVPGRANQVFDSIERGDGELLREGRLAEGRVVFTQETRIPDALGPGRTYATSGAAYLRASSPPTHRRLLHGRVTALPPELPRLADELEGLYVGIRTIDAGVLEVGLWNEAEPDVALLHDLALPEALTPYTFGQWLLAAGPGRFVAFSFDEDTATLAVLRLVCTTDNTF